MICLKLGDGEAVLEFDPPPPEPDFLKKYGEPEIYEISGNDSADPTRPPQQGLYTNGQCPACTRVWGKRTQTPAILKYLPTASDGAVGPIIGPIFSTAFLNLLAADERASLSLQPVTSLNKTKKLFYEVVGNPIAWFVGLSGFPGRGEPCRHCGYHGFICLKDNKIYQFLAKEDLPSPTPSCFVVTGGLSPSLCMTGERWRDIRRKPGTKNLVSSRIFIVPAPEVITR